MPFTKQINTEPIPGYRLLAPLGCGGYGEVWKCEAPGGIHKAIKFVYGNLNGATAHAAQAHEELRAIQLVRDIRHPFFLSIDRVECLGSELMIVTELAEKNLHELLLECQHNGQKGIDRDDLLRYLAETAEVLDLMNDKYGLQHLDVKPRNLFVVSGHVKVADFGLVTNLGADNSSIEQGSVTPLYASPEVFQGKASRFSDQYSLACCYVELLTGQLPFQGQNSRQLLLQHMNEAPDLSGLPPGDRPAIARALAKDASQRHPSCAKLIRGLQQSRTTTFQDLEHDEDSLAKQDWRVKRVNAIAAPSQSMTQTPLGKANTVSEAQWFIKGRTALPPGLTGYEFVENQGSSLLCDSWKATAPDGRMRQVKFIYGFTGKAEYAVRRLLALHHPALPSFEVMHSDPGCLVLVHDHVPNTVRERWQKCRAQKLPGIPRIELLGYLRTVAELVDYLYLQHSIYHLGLNPRLLLLSQAGLQVADFGPAHLFWLPSGQPLAERNTRYAAPELYERQVHRGTDQYSLAIMYQELLTGVHPYSGMSRAARGSLRARLNPNLTALPAGDRDAIAKALDPDPQQRWTSCSDLIRALENCAGGAEVAPRGEDAMREIILSPRQPILPAECDSASDELRTMLFDLLGQAGGALPEADPWPLPQLSPSGDELRHKFRVGLPIGAARAKVDSFREQWSARRLHESERCCEFQMIAPTNFWRQWIGQHPWLEIKVEFAPLHVMSATPIDVMVTAKVASCGKKKAAQIVQDLGMNVLESLRRYLLVNSEKRIQDRLLWPHPVEVCGVDEAGKIKPAIVCRGKDISLTGIGFYLPHELPTSQVLIRLPSSPKAHKLMIPATLVRAQRCADGWYDVGALFRMAALRKKRQTQVLVGK